MESISFKSSILLISVIIMLVGVLTTIDVQNAFAATIFIRDDPTGGDCTSVGIWDDKNNSCLLTTDLTESVVLDDNSVFLHCQFHSITGTGAGGSIGVDAINKRNVGLKNCTISNFDVGVFFTEVARGNSFNNELFGNIVGMQVESSSGISISSPNVHDNSEDGFLVSSSRRVFIFNGESTDNGKNGIVFEGVRGGIIQTMVIGGNSEDGISLQGAVNNRIRFLSSNDNGDDGISLDSLSIRNRVTNNNFVLNGGNGIHIDGGNSNTVSNNASTDNTGDGLRLAGGNSNTIINNFFNSNAQDGFFAANAANKNTVKNNVANSNSDDGFNDAKLPNKDVRLFNKYSGNTCSGNGDNDSEPAGLCI